MELVRHGVDNQQILGRDVGALAKPLTIGS